MITLEEQAPGKMYLKTALNIYPYPYMAETANTLKVQGKVKVGHLRKKTC